jgi:hypothetical protein
MHSRHSAQYRFSSSDWHAMPLMQLCKVGVSSIARMNNANNSGVTFTALTSSACSARLSTLNRPQRSPR